MRFFHHEAHEDHEENAVGYGFLQFPEPLHPVKRDLHMHAFAASDFYALNLGPSTLNLECAWHHVSTEL
jgi:hypothetical protein